MTSQCQISANNYKYKFSETIKIATTLYVSKTFVALLSKNLAFSGSFRRNIWSTTLVTNAANSVIRFEDVGMRYGVGPEVLCDITFDLPAASFHFLTGPSGAGKSSLLRLMYLANRPSRGIVSLFGDDVSKISRRALPKLRRSIGVVFQDFRLLDHQSVFDNVALPLRVAGGKESQIRKHVLELLQWVGLEDALDSLPSSLSGGEQQRVAIARAVIGRPRLLLADEPTGNVDDAIALRLLYLFEELNRMGTSVIIATHNEALVSRFKHRQLHLESGKIAFRRTGAVV